MLECRRAFENRRRARCGTAPSGVSLLRSCRLFRRRGGGLPGIALAGVPDAVDAALQRRLEYPYVAGVADEVEALAENIDARRDIGHKPSVGFVVLLAGGIGARDRVLELRMIEIAGDA